MWHENVIPSCETCMSTTYDYSSMNPDYHNQSSLEHKPSAHCMTLASPKVNNKMGKRAIVSNVLHKLRIICFQLVTWLATVRTWLAQWANLRNVKNWGVFHESCARILVLYCNLFSCSVKSALTLACTRCDAIWIKHSHWSIFLIPGACLSKNILYRVHAYNAFDTLFPSLLFTLGFTNRQWQYIIL